MLASVADLEELGLSPSDEALSEAAALVECSICLAPALDREASVSKTLSWLDRFAPEDAEKMRALLIAETISIDERNVGGRSGGDADSPIEWKSILKRNAHDSTIFPGYAVPITLLQIARSYFDEDLEYFVPDAFITAICDRCTHAQIPVAEIATRLMRTYIAQRFDGKESIARATGQWELAERFVRIVADTSREHRFSA